MQMSSDGGNAPCWDYDGTATITAAVVCYRKLVEASGSQPTALYTSNTTPRREIISFTDESAMIFSSQIRLRATMQIYTVEARGYKYRAVVGAQ